MPKPKILVTGAGGQLAKSIADVAPVYSGLEFVFLTKADMPIDDHAKVEAVFEAVQPQFCINCAAYTAVDKAESDKESAFLINAESVKALAKTCAGRQSKLLHISTDYVFNGSSAVPYKESDPVDPVNIYGASKAKGEVWAIAYDPETIIIRTAWVYSEHGNNFVKTMIRLMKEKEQLNIVDDQVGAPTYAPDLAHAIMKMISSVHWLPGIYHYCNEGRISWYDFALTIKELTGANCLLHPVPTTAYPTPAKRPAYSLLDTSKIREKYGVNIPLWKESLKKCIHNLQQG
ncbi:dTDP-4-dehydrorhamnose reductase [Agriterribacter sp.]|uniref:dTDP-4-dehydrorhamnose reductase n=1 Tax=Agriterribacter sp. TaxID=2821509 RepID=UPI002C0C3FEA|nr:dTDP-4-dehydrorhamnose reductase [Agriterribacter sp.]HRO45107.1 dTDP-4-dehydrorhamnose reductase [Agriterribacter sp.]HRQ15452.1 dTDP-4-dehydrorhamnose reductase [Agriterribacter sp.]